MSELHRFLAGEHAAALRDIATVMECYSKCWAGRMRIIADNLDVAAAELQALSARVPEREKAVSVR